MDYPKRIFTVHFYDLLTEIRRHTISICSAIIFWTSFFGVLITVYRIGFDISVSVKVFVDGIFNFLIPAIFFLFLIRFVFSFSLKKGSNVLFSETTIILILFTLNSTKVFFPTWVDNNLAWIIFLRNPIFSYVATVLVFVIEFSRSSISMLRPTLKPAIIIVGSFILLILLGTALLLLPNATTNGISIIDAFFTSTSAVCVTGLIVVDTATAFTGLGKGIILFLIQVGGLGIMTFTFFFGFFFRGNTSFQSQLFLKDALNESNLSQVFKTLLKIVLFTLAIEAIGAYLLYIQVDGNLSHRIKIAVFHSISAFCNAGFSTFSDGLLDSSIQSNYGFHSVTAILLIIGGLGFPVAFSYYLLLKHFIRSKIRQFLYPKLGYQHKPHVINAGIRLIIFTTIWLISIGTLLFLITEWNNSLVSLPWYGKLSHAFFASVTPRTAGFNTVDYSLLSNPSIIITMLLMWIGASPGSTGGGIKTSTFSVAMLSAISIARGKESVEYSGTEFSTDSIRRAFAVITLSVLIITISILFTSTFNPELDFRSISFECISAYSTVGLSLGITSSLSVGSKIVIILTMFIGRVGALTILIGILRKVVVKSYKYPKQDVLIN